MNEEFEFLKSSLQLVGEWLVHNHYVLQCLTSVNF